MPSEFRLDGNALRRTLTDAATRLIREGQRLVIATARHRSPVDTGALRLSHRPGNITIRGTRVTGDVTAEQDYAMAVHEGSRPHVIRPRRAQALTWGSGADRVFARSVNHPGSSPRPWLLNSLKDVGPRLGFRVTPGD